MTSVLPLDKNKCDFSNFWSFCSNEFGKAEDVVQLTAQTTRQIKQAGNPCSAAVKHLVKRSPLLAWKADPVPTDSVHLGKVLGKSQNASICWFSLAVFGKVFQERMSWFADKKEAEKNKKKVPETWNCRDLKSLLQEEQWEISLNLCAPPRPIKTSQLNKVTQPCS